MYAAVDLGSNSFRMHIGRFDGDAMRIVKSAREPLRLGAGLDEQGNLTTLDQAPQGAQPPPFGLGHQFCSAKVIVPSEPVPETLAM